MLFSTPDYPLFLIAVFFLYALARWGGPQLAWARIAVMVLLGDVVFMLVAKDPDTLWDPIGGALLRLAIAAGAGASHWPVGAARAVGDRRRGAARRDRARPPARRLDRVGRAARRGSRAASSSCSRAIGATVAIAWRDRARSTRSPRAIVAHGHLRRARGARRRHRRVAAPTRTGRSGASSSCSSRRALFYHAWAAAMPGPYRYLLALLLGTIVLDYYLGHLDRADRGSGAAQGARDREPVLEPRHPGVLQVHRLLHAGRAAPAASTRLHLILPAGISFHTFQSLSYTIDVYRRQLRATRSVVAVRDVRAVLPAARRRPDRARAGSAAAARRAAGARARGGDRAGCSGSSSGCSRRSRSPTRSRSSIVDRVFEAPEQFSAVEVARRRVRVRAADLPRLLGVLRHRDRLGAGPRLHAARELPHAVSLGEPPGVLAALAHQPVDAGCATTSTSRSAAAAARRGGRTST